MGKPPTNYLQWKRIMYLIMVQTYPHITMSQQNWKNIKASLKKMNWPEVLAKHESSEEKSKAILEIVIKIIEENCTTFRNQQGSHSNKIPKDRRVLFRKKKMLNKELRKRNPSDKKKRIEKAIGEIDKKLLDSYEEENCT